MVGRHEAKEWAKAHLKGLFSSPSAPFTANFALDQAGVVKNVERVIAAGASGVGFGFLDAWGLTIAQRKHAMDLIAETTGERAMCAFYTADHSVAETIISAYMPKRSARRRLSFGCLMNGRRRRT